jgi:hypothetical protein
MGTRVEENPPVEMDSMNGRRNGRQATITARLSWMVVARYAW